MHHPALFFKSSVKMNSIIKSKENRFASPLPLILHCVFINLNIVVTVVEKDGVGRHRFEF